MPRNDEAWKWAFYTVAILVVAGSAWSATRSVIRLNTDDCVTVTVVAPAQGPHGPVTKSAKTCS